MSRSINALTPKNLANKTIEDYIDNLTLQSLDVSGDLNIGGTLKVDTINEATAAGITIQNTTPGSNIDLIATGGTSRINITADEQVRLKAGSPSLRLTSTGVDQAVLGNSNGRVFLVTGNGNEIILEASDPFNTFGETAWVGQQIWRHGGGPNDQQNWTAENVSENNNEINQIGRIMVGSVFRPTVPQNANVANLVNFGITFQSPPLVVVSSNNQRVNVSAVTITTTSVTIGFRELVGTDINNVVASFIVIGRPDSL